MSNYNRMVDNDSRPVLVEGQDRTATNIRADNSINLEVIDYQPEKRDITFLRPVPTSNGGVLTYPHIVNEKERGLCHTFSQCLIALFCVALCPISCLVMFIYPCCSLNGRTSFMSFFKSCYLNCCCIFDCVTPLTLADAMRRYEETPLMSAQDLIKSMIQNKFLISILETLNQELPEFFISFLPTGSLREQFARILPSNSILASDYDVMMIPDAVYVGKEGMTSVNRDKKPVFSVISSAADHPDGYVWLKLKDTYLIQWEKYCLRRPYQGKGVALLSSEKLLTLIKEKITNSQHIRSTVRIHFQRHIRKNNILIPVEKKRNGPALTVKVQVQEKQTVCLGYYNDIDTLIFHADFTLGLHCCFWPTEAEDFFSTNRRKYWPASSVVETIKALGCHVIPKKSTNALVKLTSEQPEYTTYGRSPGLEWRYSFSQAEMTLTDNLPAPARTAFLSFKAINKRHLNMRGREMSSYPLKCILLYLMESKPKQFWDGEYMEVAEEFLKDLLQNLKICFEHRICPHYWIPTIDVLELSGSDCARKLRLLEDIISDPKKYIADQWLEHTRCIRLNCCYCGPLGLIKQYIRSSEVPDTHVKQPNNCCSINYEYDEKPTACGPCDTWVDYDMY